MNYDLNNFNDCGYWGVGLMGNCINGHWCNGVMWRCINGIWGDGVMG